MSSDFASILNLLRECSRDDPISEQVLTKSPKQLYTAGVAQDINAALTEPDSSDEEDLGIPKQKKPLPAGKQIDGVGERGNSGHVLPKTFHQVFEKQHGYVFTPAEVDSNKAKPRTSLLTTVIQKKDSRNDESASVIASLNVAAIDPASTAKGAVFKVFICSTHLSKDAKQKSVVVKVRDNATVEQTIGCTLAQCFQDQMLTLEQLRPRAYVMRLADVDGTADEDFPPLGRSQPVAKFQTEEFALCDNPQAAKDLAVEDSRAQSEAAAASKEPAQIRVKIHLPLRETTTLVCSSGLTVRELCALVAQKRFLSQEQFFLGMVDSPVPLDPDRTLRDLGATVFTLFPQSGVREEDLTRDRPRRSSSGTNGVGLDEDEDNDVSETDFFFSEFTASQYKEYAVVKINKFGVPQERRMGVDRTAVYNMKPKDRVSGFLSSKAVKRSKRTFDEIVGVVLHEVDTRRFFIEFVEGGDVKRQEYIGKSRRQTAEICARLRFLIELSKGV
eukprot:GCRY01003010.1.p1 GENE.GCRY01003010.1~~GCRY01003010.1.p1  ORF type:complete len:501 (+),score=135.81 GCRY01003010.1:239-1741(+)